MYRNQQQRPKRDNNDQLVYGIRAVMEAVEAGKEFDRLFITRGSKGELMGELKKLLREKEVPWTEVPIEKIHRLTRNNHQDVAGYISAISYSRIMDVVPRIFEEGRVPLIIVLDRITDVRNLGAIARTAECAGVDAIVIPAQGSAQITADAIKASAGALNRIEICREKNLRDTQLFLQQSGICVFGASEKGKIDYYESDLAIPSAIILGSEEDGISADLLKRCDELIRIPMFGKISSLNVSVSCGILIFEALRQRASQK